MSFLPPFLIGAAVGSIVTWQIDRRKQSRWVRQISKEGGLTPAQSRQSEPQQGGDGTPQTAVDISEGGSGPAAPSPASPSVLHLESLGSVSKAAEAPRGQDQLEEIRGIGPVFATRLKAAGIRTFAELAALTPERIVEIVTPDNTAENNLIDPQDWIRQAHNLAQEGLSY
jgi:predicted flap endonuclease-1-like 5' DNA nuclease